jgi:molecular chaperone GrpE (heat shock protein)
MTIDEIAPISKVPALNNPKEDANSEQDTKISQFSSLNEMTIDEMASISEVPVLNNLKEDVNSEQASKQGAQISQFLNQNEMTINETMPVFERPVDLKGDVHSEQVLEQATQINQFSTQNEITLDETTPLSEKLVLNNLKEDANSEQVSELGTQISQFSSQNDVDFNKVLLTVQQLEQKLEAGLSQVLNAFEQKIAFDATKQQQIDRLHAELQEYRTDLIAKTKRPLVNGLIRLHDDIGRLLEGLKSKPLEQLEPEQFLKAIGGIQEDIEILLDQNGVTAFRESTEEFQPRRQRAVKNQPTTDEKLVGQIIERLKPGFEQGNEIIQKERVSVYVFDKNTINSQQQPENQESTNG